MTDDFDTVLLHRTSAINRRDKFKQVGGRLILVGAVMAGAFVAAMLVMGYFDTPEITESIVVYEGEQVTNDLSFSRDGTLLAAAQSDGHVRVWDVETRQLVHDLYAPISRDCSVNASSVDFSPEGRWLLVGRTGGEVQVWDSATGLLSWRIDVDEAYPDQCRSVHDARYSPDGSQILVSSNSVWLWDVETREQVDGIGWNSGPRVSFHPDGRWVAMGQDAGYEGFYLVDLNDPNGWVHVPTPNTSSGLNIFDLEFSADGQFVAAALANGKFHVWDMREFPIEVGDYVTEQHNPDFPNRVSTVAFSPTHDLLAVAGDFPMINVWDIRREDDGLALKKLVNIRGHGPLAFSPDGNWIASKGEDGSIRLWDVEDVGR